MRVLVTGSRNWQHADVIYSALEAEHASARSRGERLTVVHGLCPQGADAMADDWARYGTSFGFGVERETHRAEWEKYGKPAGFIRNQEMVDLGADVCLAFCRDDSSGTMDCVNRAAKAGIPVRIYREDVLGDYLGCDF